MCVGVCVSPSLWKPGRLLFGVVIISRMLIKTSVERSHTSDAVLHKPDGLDTFFLFSLWFLASNLLVSVYIGTELKALTLTAAREFWERK